jgi:LAGLIDADG-like domain
VSLLPINTILDRVREKAGTWDCDLKLNADITYRITKRDCCGLKNPLIDHLRELELWGKDSSTKFIPTEYLEASRTTRLRLLQGLMDTDGTTGKTRETSYAKCSRQLGLDVQYLVRSLGGICSISERKTKCKYKDRLWKVLFATT